MTSNSQNLRATLVSIFILGAVSTAFGQGAPGSTPAPSPVPDKMDILQQTANEIQTSVSGVSAKVDASNQSLQQIQTLVNELKGLTGDGFAQVSHKADQIQTALNSALTSLSSLNTLSKAIQIQTTQLQSGVATLQTKLDQTASTLNQLKRQVGENEARAIEKEIEDQLRNNKYEIALFIPARHHGQLDLVKDIVSTAYRNTAANAQGDDSQWYLDNAKNHLDSASSAFDDGVWGKALDQFGKAYRDLVKANRYTRP